MLKRYAVLVGSTEGATSIPAVRDDLTIMKNYLNSCPGGGWRDDEIRMFLNRSTGDILAEVERLRRDAPDYLLFYWSGHGYVIDQSQMLQPAPAEDIPLDSLFGLADRQLIILDTCRKDVPRTPAIVEASFREAMAVTKRNRDLYRSAYDHYISQCGPSLQIAYACQPGEDAGASLHGSFYTKALVCRALRWKLPARRKHGFASIRRLMQKSTANGAQPDYYHSAKGTRPRCFPFAVGLYR